MLFLNSPFKVSLQYLFKFNFDALLLASFRVNKMVKD
jgi:hypothetical protein